MGIYAPVSPIPAKERTVPRLLLSCLATVASISFLAGCGTTDDEASDGNDAPDDGRR